MAWMSDEQYLLREDTKEKSITARSARSTRTHCGKGDRVRLPSDYLSKKELKAMNGECKSYRMNAPMTWKEFKELPDDLKVIYIKSLRNKYDVPSNVLADRMGVHQATFCKYMRCLGLGQGKAQGSKSKKWDRQAEFDNWWYGVKLETPVNIPEEPSVEPVVAAEEKNIETPEVREEVVEAALAAIGEAAATVLEEMDNNASDNYAERVDQYCESINNNFMDDETEGSNPGPTAFTGHHMPVIPKSGTMSFENNRANDALDTIKCLLSDARVNLYISWECVFETDSTC